MSDLKHCHQCGRDRQRSEFSPRRQTFDGLRPECRECRNRRQRRNRLKNLEKARAYDREYMRARRRADPAKANAAMTEWRRKNLIKVKEIAKRHHLKHREKRLAQSAQWTKLNPRRRRALAKNWRLKNPERAKAIARKSQVTNRDKVNQRSRNRRALKAAAQGSHSLSDVRDILRLQNGKCAHPWCATNIADKYTVDHKIALARGGSNDRSNIQLLCGFCNSRKHAKHPIDLAREHGLLL